MHRAFCFLAASALLTGCAGYKLTPISVATARSAHPETGEGKEGYIFHAPAPYLLASLKVKDEENPVYETQLVYLPDYERPYRFTRYEHFAKSDLDISFTNGWMFTGADSSTDTTAAIQTITEIAKAAAGLLGPAGQGEDPEPFLLFKFEHDAGGIRLRRVSLPVDWNMVP